MHQRADATDTLSKGPGVSRVAAFQDGLNTAHHGAGRIGLLDFIAIHLGFNAQMTFYTGDRVNYNSFVFTGFAQVVSLFL